MTTDGGLFGAPRREGPTPKLVVIGVAWAAFGVVALITAVLMRSVGIAVFGVLCFLAGGGLYLGQRARERLEEDERSWRSDPGGYLDDDLDDDLEPEPDDAPDGPADDEDDPQHATRVMSRSSHDGHGREGHGHDDIVDAEYTEYYEPSPSEQDDGTGYDDEETAYRRRREDEWARESRAREDDTRVIEADDDTADDTAHDTAHETTADRADDTADSTRDGHGTHAGAHDGTPGGTTPDAPR